MALNKYFLINENDCLLDASRTCYGLTVSVAYGLANKFGATNKKTIPKS